jgi:toxin-antitoxin system PIN domain toxin
VVLVDTNIFVHAANTRSESHAECRVWIDARCEHSDAWYTTWPILYEFLRVVTHRNVMRRPWTVAKAWSFVTTLLESPGFAVLTPTDRHSDVAGDVLTELPQLSGNILHDTHTAILMREHGIRRICTKDADFHRFPFLEVVEPE